ncbi:hypothetical protein [Adhaeribacter pallidiroseus]|uniref:Uncharacterized protein n=1 Tax=Adhaeribacter pallidiroseus TaxID=2072847 RepID=A0A369Q2T0_9BACT|nr:hypothetical protein [Adhaeribacter pallidiroseus]RDC58822.1 hypothetical protein AHMF7616_05256 [Adhaeribacter pallidiroseus]
MSLSVRHPKQALSFLIVPVSTGKNRHYSKLTIAFQKGRRGTIIGKIVELPHIITRGSTLEEVRAKIVTLLASQVPSTRVNR